MKIKQEKGKQKWYNKDMWADWRHEFLMFMFTSIQGVDSSVKYHKYSFSILRKFVTLSHVIKRHVW